MSLIRAERHPASTPALRPCSESHGSLLPRLLIERITRRKVHAGRKSKWVGVEHGVKVVDIHLLILSILVHLWRGSISWANLWFRRRNAWCGHRYSRLVILLWLRVLVLIFVRLHVGASVGARIIRALVGFDDLVLRSIILLVCNMSTLGRTKFYCIEGVGELAEAINVFLKWRWIRRGSLTLHHSG